MWLQMLPVMPRKGKSENASHLEFKIPHHSIPADDDLYFFIGNLQGNFILIQVL